MKKSQFRQHLRFSWRNQFRSFIFKQRLKASGKGVFYDKNIEILRFPKNVSISDYVAIKEGTRICACNNEAKITIGQNTTIGYHTFIFASNQIDIGSDCLIAPFVYIVDSNHQISRDLPINQQSNDTSAISIGDDVWVGTGAKILKGVHIGDGAVIAAGAIVSSDVKPYEIFGGIPARKIGERK